MKARAAIRAWLPFAGAGALTIPGLVLRLTEFSHAAGVEAALFGIAILGAAFLLSWGVELAEVDISQALAVALVALVAVLPEYAVSMVFAWKAADDPEFAQYALANMTGANRLLVGVGWSMVVFIFWWKRRGAPVVLDRRYAVELAFLLVATGWAFTIFLRSFFLDDSLTLVDSAVLVALFGFYLATTARGKREEPTELVGPVAVLAALGKLPRRGIALGLFIVPALIIIASAEPFADGLVETGKEFEIDEFILVQWVAPLASEAPELVIAALFAFRGMGSRAMGLLISSKVNQWTLLVGTLPVVYSVNLGGVGEIHLGNRQLDEFLLTSAQSLFAVILLVTLRISWRGGAALLVLFVTQLFFTDPQARVIYALIYLGLTFTILLLDRQRRQGSWSLIPRALQELRTH